MSFTLMLLHRPSGEHDKLATTAFFLPDDVPEMLPISTLIQRYWTGGNSNSETHLVNQMSSMYVLEGYLSQLLALVS